MLTKEDFTAVKDELADDFVTLADEQLAVVWQLVAQLDDDRLDNQIQFESYERNRLRQEAAKNVATVNLSDEEPLPTQRPDGDEVGMSQPESNQAEQPQQPPVPGAGQTPSKEQRSEEPEQQQQSEQQQKQQQQQEPIPEEPLETLEHSILDIFDED